jgi:hypothetical protein
MCPRVLVPIVGLSPPDLMGPLLRLHHHRLYKPVSIEQLLATQNELMQVLTENLVHRGGH